MTPKSCNVADLMIHTANVMQSMAEKFKVTLSISPQSTALSTVVYADDDRIIQTLTNLLSNAIKFSPPQSTVYLKAELRNVEETDLNKPQQTKNETERHCPIPHNLSTALSVLFSVSDRGGGIPSDKLDTIFERFQQVDASDSRNQDGTGLELAICRNIVQQHGGRIWVESTLGQGSTFYFTLPIGEQSQ
jgi:signal transduction histidine kinase